MANISGIECGVVSKLFGFLIALIVKFKGSVEIKKAIGRIYIYVMNLKTCMT